MGLASSSRKKGTPILCVVVSLVLLTSCATVPHRKAVSLVQLGMTPNEVREAAGDPLDRSFIGKQERWVFGAEEPGSPKKVVLFREGRVVGMDSATDEELAKSLSKEAAHQAQAATTLLPCSGKNHYGSFADGGGCNLYGCWPPGGYCNGFGCSSQGACTVRGCPKKIAAYRCVE